VRGRGTRGSTGAHLGKEVRSGAVGHMVVPKPPLLQGGVVQSYSIRGITWMHALLLVLT
jgi:hypothetical protein